MNSLFSSPLSQLRPVGSKISRSSGQMVISSDFGKNLYVHSIVVPSINVSPDYKVSAASTPFVNFRGDAIPTPILEANKNSMIGVPIYVEHAQIPGTEQGQIRDIQWYKHKSNGEDIMVIDGLMEVPGNKTESIQAICDGYFKSVSQSCLAERSVCSKCGHISFETDDFCDHIKNEVLGYFKGKDGKQYIVANVLGDLSKPEGSIIFIEVSLVANPAFFIANFREVYNIDDVQRYLKTKDAYSNFQSWDSDFLYQASEISPDFDNFFGTLQAMDKELAHDTMVSSHIFYSSLTGAKNNA